MAKKKKIGNVKIYAHVQVQFGHRNGVATSRKRLVTVDSRYWYKGYMFVVYENAKTETMSEKIVDTMGAKFSGWSVAEAITGRLASKIGDTYSFPTKEAAIDAATGITGAVSLFLLSGGKIADLILKSNKIAKSNPNEYIELIKKGAIKW